jgi:hypothetical protein
MMLLKLKLSGEKLFQVDSFPGLVFRDLEGYIS